MDINEITEDELASVLAELDSQDGFRKLSYQKQARFIIDHLKFTVRGVDNLAEGK